MSDKCPECGGPTSCLAGCSAHPNNWYCSNVTGCGWEAWAPKSVKPKEVPVPAYYHVLAMWDEADASAGTWAEVIAIEEDGDPYEVTKDVMCQMHEDYERERILIIECVLVSEAIDSMLAQIPPQTAKTTLTAILARLGR